MSETPSVRVLIACSAAILVISMGVRHAFGLFMAPMGMEFGWGREVFAFAMGLQNLVWGLAQPFAGAFGDRHGAHRVTAAGAFLYAAGLLGMAFSTSPAMLAATGGVLIGMAQACTTYSVVFGAMGRRIDPARRSWAMGVISAAGSFGQFFMMPVTERLVGGMGWSGTLLAYAGVVLAIAPLARGMLEPARPAAADGQGAGAAVVSALRERSYVLLAAGYFVCGFQVVFIGVHLPSYLKDVAMPAHVAPTALALIGLFNIFGSYAAGVLGSRYPLRHLLALIYFSRSICVSLFLLLPVSEWTVYAFSAAIGLLWLSTVPPTNALIARAFGVKHLSTLSGIAFLSHQIGSFLGVWLGGYLFDRFGSYDIIWALIVGAGIAAALLNEAIVEPDARREAPAPA